MSVIRANGLDVAYAVEGDGPPLVLLHGASSSSRVDFGPYLPNARRAFRCYLPDARGHGGTRWDAADGFRYEWLVDDVAGFVDALGLDTLHLMGFSMGGVTALAYAIRHPERLRTLVLIGTTMEREPRASVVRRLLDPGRIETTDPRWAAELARAHDPVQGVGAWRRLLSAIAADVESQPLPTAQDVHRIGAPALVAVGDRDPIVPVDQALALRRLLPDARLLVAPRSGHEVIRRRPALFNEAVGGFYRETVAEAPPDRSQDPAATSSGSAGRTAMT
jgi:pimeloyl-ACP methyl ester carboxylesterase